MSTEISEAFLETASKKYAGIPAELLKRYIRDDYDKIYYTSYDNYENYNLIDAEIYNDEKKEAEIQAKGPPPMPQFNKRDWGHNVVRIEELLFEPERSSRPDKIFIVIRGPPGSGKTRLAELIIKKEREMGNQRTRFITPHRYYKKFNRDEVEKYINNLHDETKFVVSEGFYTFVVLEFEGGDDRMYSNMTDMAKKFGGYELYVIDIYQEPDVCMKYMKNNRSHYDVQKVIKDLREHAIPYDHKIIDPVEIIEPGWRAKQPRQPGEPEKKREVERKYEKKNDRKDKKRSRFGSDDDEEMCFVCYG